MGGNCDKPAASCRLPMVARTYCRRMISRLPPYYPSVLWPREEEAAKSSVENGETQSLRVPFAHQPVTPREAEYVADIFQRAGIAHDDVRAGGFFDQRHLGGLAGCKLLR
jgi:hypothetical protein